MVKQVEKSIEDIISNINYNLKEISNIIESDEDKARIRKIRIELEVLKELSIAHSYLTK